MNRNEYDFWVFDLDGTLVDIHPSYPREVVGAVGDELGVAFTDREVECLWYGMGESRDRVLGRCGVAPQRFWEVFHQVEDPTDRASATYLYDDAERFVSAVDGPVGLVTHCQQYLTDPVLDRLDIGDWFDAVICCDDEVGWKPDPDPIERVMRRMNVGSDGQAGVLVGDDADDIGAAWNAGLDGVHVERHDPATRGRCVWGDHRVTSLADLH